jgi:hypothetical protein
MNEPVGCKKEIEVFKNKKKQPRPSDAATIKSKRLLFSDIFINYSYFAH